MQGTPKNQIKTNGSFKPEFLQKPYDLSRCGTASCWAGEKSIFSFIFNRLGIWIFHRLLFDFNRIGKFESCKDKGRNCES
jgi:hypothetical protein